MDTPAYFKPGMSAHMLAPRDSAWDRLRLAGPWATGSCVHPTAGHGCMAWWAGFQQPDPLQITWRSEPEPDGLWYAPPATIPEQHELAKRDCPRGIDVVTLGGLQLTIPLASAAPRKLVLSAKRAGDPATDFGRKATAVFERLKVKGSGVQVTDPDVLSLVTQALMMTYRVTPELLDDLGWITTADVDPILCAIMGSDPKASNPAGDSSP